MDDACDIDALTPLIHRDATQSLPPNDPSLAGRDEIATWWFGPGTPMVIPTSTPNGSPDDGH